MSKPVLGRGLGSLLGDDKVAGRTEAAPLTSAAAPVGRGVGSLLQGTRPDGTPASNPFNAPTLEKWAAGGLRFGLPRWTYFAADALLLALALGIALRNPAQLSPVQLAACATLVAVGCVLAVLPFLARKNSAPGNAHNFPVWIWGKAGDAGGKNLVIRLHPPRFIGEVTLGNTGQIGVMPLWLEEDCELAPPEFERLLREANEFCRSSAERK
ncbi:MAG: hypothetical protein HZA89_17700 [Verrucomicrobia bacterium]|nr:hypothetical protein [Verrucomicrobiota bacterium]